MKVYNYDPETGIYINEGIADESPLEEGVWLIPAHATEIAPPSVPEGKVAVWKDGSWSVETAPAKPEPIKPNPVPEPTQQERANAAARRYLGDTDWYVIRQVETGVAVPQEILDKRAAARESIKE